MELWPHLQVVIAPIEPLPTDYLPEKSDSIPLPLEHLNEGYSITAIMLLISLLRQADWEEMNNHQDENEL